MTIEAYKPVIHEEIASQPSCWERLLTEPTSDGQLPPAGVRVLAIGCGTSLHMANCYAHLREAHGLGETHYAPASQLPIGRRYEAVMVISRSGATTEIVRALDSLPHGTRTFGIVGEEATPVANMLEVVTVLQFANEQAVVQTRFPTTALNFLRMSMGEQLRPVISDGKRALSAPLPRPNGDLKHVVFLGDGWTVGLAHEAALKFRETAGGWSESYPSMEFRHGPISAATSETLIWTFDPLPDGLDELLARKVGAQVEIAELDPVAELTRVQRQAVRSAESRGRNPDLPSFLDRAVILP